MADCLDVGAGLELHAENIDGETRYFVNLERDSATGASLTCAYHEQELSDWRGATVALEPDEIAQIESWFYEYEGV